MKCQWCGKEFPNRKGRFCGTCKSPQQLAIQFAEAEANRLGGLLRNEQQRVFAVEAERDQLKHAVQVMNDARDCDAELVQRLVEERNHVAVERNRYREFMQEFCDRVDRGEVRSKKTYAKFKEALAVKP